MKTKYSKEEIYDAAFNHLLEMSHHDLAEYCWDSMTDKEKKTIGKMILEA